MKNSQMKRIGIIGVGLLGSAVASRLLKGGFEVTAYDTRLEQVEALQAQGLVAAASIAAAAAEADAVFTILPSLESVETTILGAGGLIETAPQNCTVIQMSTVSPNLTRRLGNAAAAKALGFLDAPMSGTSAMVERGDGAIFVAGDRCAGRCLPAYLRRDREENSLPGECRHGLGREACDKLAGRAQHCGTGRGAHPRGKSGFGAGRAG